MTTLPYDYGYCAFVDVLGYGNIVLTTEKNTIKKIQMLESVFDNLQTTVSFTLNLINKNNKEKIFIKSFSDSFYLQSKEPSLILFSLFTIFSRTFGYYTNFEYDEKCTLLLRAGLVNDWTLKIMDLGSLSRQPIEKMVTDEEFENIIGLGVARAYFTSEKTYLSGMRIIISPEIFENFHINEYKDVPFECYFAECKNILFDSNLPHDSENVKLFFLPIRENEKGEKINLYELCWPVYKYGWSNNDTDIHYFLNEIIKIKKRFTTDNIRHLKKTAELIYKSFIITQTVNPESYSKDEILYFETSLKEIIALK